MTTFHRRPQFQAPIYKLPSARAAVSEDDQMPTKNLSELLGQVSKNSTGEIDSLIGEFGRLPGTLQTDGERIQHEIEEYAALSQQVMQLTKTISESVENMTVSAGGKSVTGSGRLAGCISRKVGSWCVPTRVQAPVTST
jgi:hypothetical protein